MVFGDSAVLLMIVEEAERPSGGMGGRPDVTCEQQFEQGWSVLPGLGRTGGSLASAGGGFRMVHTVQFEAPDAGVTALRLTYRLPLGMGSLDSEVLSRSQG